MEEVNVLKIVPELNQPTEIVWYKDSLIVNTSDGLQILTNEGETWKGKIIYDSNTVIGICVAEERLIVSDAAQFQEMEFDDGKLVPSEEGLHECLYSSSVFTLETDSNNIKHNRIFIYTCNQLFVHKIFTDEEVDTKYHFVAGSLQSGYKNGPIAESRFSHLSGIALDKKRNLVVTDSGNSAIRYIDFQNDMVSTIADQSTNSILQYPTSITLDNTRNIAYVSESCVCVLRVYLDTKIVSMVTTCCFAEPCGLCLHPNNQLLYLCDRCDNVVYQFNLNLPPLALPWNVARLVWIGNMKNTTDCPLATLPREIVKHIITITNIQFREQTQRLSIGNHGQKN